MRVQYLLATLLNIIFGAVVFLLGLRIVLRLFGANPSTPFVSWTYSVSESLLTPFRGIFPTTQLVPGSVFDIPAFVALLVYGIAFYLVASIVNMIANGAQANEERVVNEEHVHSHV